MNMQLFFEVFHNGVQIQPFTGPNNPVGAVLWKLKDGASVSLTPSSDKISATVEALEVGVSTITAVMVGVVSTVAGVTGLFAWTGEATLTVTEAAPTPITSGHIGLDEPSVSASELNISLSWSEAVPQMTS